MRLGVTATLNFNVPGMRVRVCEIYGYDDVKRREKYILSGVVLVVFFSSLDVLLSCINPDILKVGDL